MSNKVFDLDTLEREGARDPFVVRVGGAEVTFLDPQELDWQDLTGADQGDPKQFLGIVLGDKDRDIFFSERLPAWKLNELMKAYLKHYGLTPPPELNA